MAETGNTLSDASVVRLSKQLRRWEGTPDAPPPDRAQPFQPAGRPNLACILLEDLPNGVTVDAAVLKAETNNETQLVTIFGEPSGGGFKLGWKDTAAATPAYTAEIPWWAAAADMQAALDLVDGLNPGDVVVSLGHRDDTAGTSHFLARWLIEFTGQYAGDDVELLVVQNLLEGVASVSVTPAEIPVDSGRLESVRCLIPLGIPTPLQAGALCHAEWLHGFGYCITAAEPRQLELSDTAYG